MPAPFARAVRMRADDDHGDIAAIPHGIMLRRPTCKKSFLSMPSSWMSVGIQKFTA